MTNKGTGDRKGQLRQELAWEFVSPTFARSGALRMGHPGVCGTDNGNDNRISLRDDKQKGRQRQGQRRNGNDNRRFHSASFRMTLF
jgi:hypothetical protein